MLLIVTYYLCKCKWLGINLHQPPADHEYCLWRLDARSWPFLYGVIALVMEFHPDWNGAGFPMRTPCGKTQIPRHWSVKWSFTTICKEKVSLSNFRTPYLMNPWQRSLRAARVCGSLLRLWEWISMSFRRLPVIGVTALWLRSEVLLSHWSHCHLWRTGSWRSWLSTPKLSWTLVLFFSNEKWHGLC